MENEKKIDSLEKIENFLRENKNILLIFLTLIIFFLIAISYLNYYQNSKNEKVSEKFVQAGIYLSLNQNEKSKKIYKEIIKSKNKFYSLLALNNIIDNDLEKNNEEILELFTIVENSKIEKEQKNLVKLKKALYLIKISKDNEGDKLLNEIISDNSIWKETASEISKF
ncbi:hypothetical protein IDH12_04040 [Pelagibacterales bacterium SAG-MED29]|nr:hypothetical protein [Pelagibacterales bacterium SAG-MED29]